MSDRDARPRAGDPPPASARAGRSLFVFSAGEQAAIAGILRDFPESVQALENGLRAILERLIPSCRGRLRSEADVDYLLMGLADRVVTRTTGDEPDALGTAAIDLVTRHILAGLRDEFLRGVLARRPDALRDGAGPHPPNLPQE
jgi:hypothetical protein